jgi:hypothetical protein
MATHVRFVSEMPYFVAHDRLRDICFQEGKVWDQEGEPRSGGEIFVMAIAKERSRPRMDQHCLLERGRDKPASYADSTTVVHNPSDCLVDCSVGLCM